MTKLHPRDTTRSWQQTLLLYCDLAPITCLSLPERHLAVVLVPFAGCTSGVRALTLGIAIPALVYALMRVDAARYIDCHAKA